MKNNTMITRGGCRVEIRASERRSFVEYHITATIEGPGPLAEAADGLLTQVAAALAERKIQPIQEKLYGRTTAKADVLARRAAIYTAHGLDAAVPITWIEGLPLHACDFVAIQVWGIASRDASHRVTTVENPVTGKARQWTGRGFRMLHLPAVRGTTADSTLPAGHVAQAEQMFTNVGQGLQAHGLRYTNVVRTWIYLSRLLEWYGDLNRVRTAHYKPAGFGCPGGMPWPASTGIQGRTGDEECLVDVLALESEGPEFAAATAVTRSPRQDQSFNYGSAFSRGMTIDIEGRRTIHISGTASINTAGDSTHLGDAECQSLETLMSIAAILEDHGGTLQHITSATLFCKNRAAWEAWNRVTRLLQIPDLPKVCVIADVCRDNLLVEMEAVAVI